MLGFKIKTVKTQGLYTLKTLYDQIKDVEFTAGKPEWTLHGLGYIITFPPIDMNNQIWILPGGFSATKPTNKFSIQKQQEAGIGNLVGREALDDLSDGWATMGSAFGKKAKNAEKLVEITAKELDALGL